MQHKRQLRLLGTMRRQSDFTVKSSSRTKANLKRREKENNKKGCLVKDENLCLEAAMWVRENACKKGEENMTTKSFCQWVNDQLLPSHSLPPNLLRQISLRTATRWLHQLGYRPLFLS